MGVGPPECGVVASGAGDVGVPAAGAGVRWVSVACAVRGGVGLEAAALSAGGVGRCGGYWLLAGAVCGGVDSGRAGL